MQDPNETQNGNENGDNPNTTTGDQAATAPTTEHVEGAQNADQEATQPTEAATTSDEPKKVKLIVTGGLSVDAEVAAGQTLTQALKAAGVNDSSNYTLRGTDGKVVAGTKKIDGDMTLTSVQKTSGS